MEQLNNEVKTLIKEDLEKIKQNELKIEDSNIKAEIIQQKIQERDIYFGFFSVSAAISILLIFFGFRLWYIKVQIPIDKQLGVYRKPHSLKYWMHYLKTKKK